MTLQPTLPSDESHLTMLHIRRWHDPLIDELGHDARSRYVERFWLGILGPSTTLLLRALTDELDASGGAAEIDLGDVAAQLGIGHNGGRNSALARSLQRACRFGAARVAGRQELEIRHRLPPLNRAQIERLPSRLAIEHVRLVDAGRTGSEHRARARRLALSLIECGDGFDEAERQLDRWRVPDSIAAEAVSWAWERHRLAAEHSPDAA